MWQRDRLSPRSPTEESHLLLLIQGRYSKCFTSQFWFFKFSLILLPWLSMTSRWLKRLLLSRALELRKVLLLLQWQRLWRSFLRSKWPPLMMLPKLQPSEAPVVTLAMKELLVQLAPTLIVATSVPPLTSESIPAVVTETGSMSVPAQPELVVDILESLVLQ